MRQNSSGVQVRPSLSNGPTVNSLPSPNPSLQPTRPHMGPHRPLGPQPQPQLLANGPVGHAESLPVGNNSSNQPGPTATGPNGDVPYLQPAGSGDAATLPHTCTRTQTQDSAPRQALHLNSSQVRNACLFNFFPQLKISFTADFQATALFKWLAKWTRDNNGKWGSLFFPF